MKMIERTHLRPARGEKRLMSRITQLRQSSLYGDGSVILRMQELVDTLAWIRIELAPSPDASASPSDAIGGNARSRKWTLRSISPGNLSSSSTAS